jgi:hypothetical protein
MSSTSFSVSEEAAMQAFPQLLDMAVHLAADINAAARANILGRAQRDGWSAEQAEWLDRLSKQGFFDAVQAGVEAHAALDSAFDAARRELVGAYFDRGETAKGGRFTAFLILVELERELACRRGDTPAEYSEAALTEACRTVDASHQAGLRRDEQIAAGFESLRRGRTALPS